MPSFSTLERALLRLVNAFSQLDPSLDPVAEGSTYQTLVEVSPSERILLPNLFLEFKSEKLFDSVAS